MYYITILTTVLCGEIIWEVDKVYYDTVVECQGSKVKVSTLRQMIVIYFFISLKIKECFQSTFQSKVNIIVRKLTAFLTNIPFSG